MNTNTLIVILIVVIVFAVAVYISYSRQNKEEDIAKDIKYKLAKIPSSSSNNINELKSILIEHDKLFDYYLKKKHLKGETFGERLKNAKQFFDYESYNKIWEAHKMRNTLVHEFQVEFKPELVKKEIYNFRKILENAK